MTLSQIKSLATNLMTQHGLIQKGWTFKWTNARTQAGICAEYRYKDAGYIGLSRYLMPHFSEEKIKDTILHEIAHALVGNKHGHDYVWQRKAIEIGCDGERCYTTEAFKQESKDVLIKQSKYVLTCPSCGTQTPKHRKITRDKACGKCCREHNYGRYSEEYKLVLTQNY